MTLLFTTVVLLGAFLLLLVEPMSGKRLLPLFGAAPSVWNTCLLFFQAALVAGYAYAHAVSAWLDPRRRLALHAALVLLPLPFLPFVVPSVGPPAQSSPTAWLLHALVVSVGLPFFVLAAGGPLLQSWFSKTDAPRARAPWFLFAASNLGSLLALLAYPAMSLSPTTTAAAPSDKRSRCCRRRAAPSSRSSASAREPWRATPDQVRT